MKIQDSNESVLNMGLGDPTSCVYQLITDESDSNEAKIIQYFTMHGLQLCIKLDSFVSHMFFAWSIIHDKAEKLI